MVCFALLDLESEWSYSHYHDRMEFGISCHVFFLVLSGCPPPIISLPLPKNESKNRNRSIN